MKNLECAFNAFFTHPMFWPRWLRRTFILFIPISAPVWVVSAMCFLLVAVFFITTMNAVGFTMEVWLGRRPTWYADYLN